MSSPFSRAQRENKLQPSGAQHFPNLEIRSKRVGSQSASRSARPRAVAPKRFPILLSTAALSALCSLHSILEAVLASRKNSSLQQGKQSYHFNSGIEQLLKQLLLKRRSDICVYYIPFYCVLLYLCVFDCIVVYILLRSYRFAR